MSSATILFRDHSLTLLVTAAFTIKNREATASVLI